ncbi:MAG: cobalamin biosynthesis protein CbiG [Chloroflexi bacterium]|nr:cobalamin biosynthesis protein CbiG [Chloroflexota bacterium]
MNRMDGNHHPHPNLPPSRGKECSAAIVAISRRGAALGARVRDALGDDAALYVERRFSNDANGAIAFDLPVRPLVGRLFGECENLVLMMPVGAAVRLLAAQIGDKHTDAAVVCVDDGGRFAVSLLSGHVGGADALAGRVADAIGATAVITSASHVLETLAVDLLGSEFGWRIEASSAMVTRASAAVVNGEPVGVYQDAGERDWWASDRPLPPNLNICATVEGLAEYPNVLLISDRTDVSDRVTALEPETLVVYRPRSLVVGIGSRRGVGIEELKKLLHRTFAAFDLSINAIKCIATAELKRDEAAMGLLAERLGVAVRYFGADELNAMPGPSGASESQRLLGIVAVAEPAALLASGGDIVVPKVRSAAAALAVARINIDGQDREDFSPPSPCLHRGRL